MPPAWRGENLNSFGALVFPKGKVNCWMPSHQSSELTNATRMAQ